MFSHIMQDERAEDVLGVNALLNKHMMESLLKWKNAPWRLHFCTSHQGKPLYGHPLQGFTTVAAASTRETFQRCEEQHISSVPSVLESHSLHILNDITFASRLETELDVDESSSETARNLSRLAIGAAMRAANANKGKSKMASSEGGSGQLKSLQELIGNINKEAEDVADKAGGRGTRFTHAAAFAHEENASSLIGSAPTTGGGGASSSAHDVPTASSRAPAQSAAESAESAAAARKAKQEADDRARQEELDNLKQQINELEASGKTRFTVHLTNAFLVEDFQRNQNNAVSKIRQLESEVRWLSM